MVCLQQCVVSPECPVVLVFEKKPPPPPGLRCDNLAKHFVPHVGSFSTPVQKYRRSVKALMHNSPPSVHSTCCVIKAVLEPLLLRLVSISLSLSLFLSLTLFFFLIVLFAVSLSLSSVSDCLTHTHTHTLLIFHSL